VNLRRQTPYHMLFRKVPTILSTQASTGLLLYCAVVEMQIVQLWRCKFQANLWNPAKFTKTHKIPRNLLEILPNTCQNNKFESYLYCWVCLLATNWQICLEILSLQQINNNPKQRPPSDHYVKIDHDSKHFAIGTFLNHFVVKRAHDDLCYWKEPSGQTNSKLTLTFLSWQVWEPKQVAQF